MTETSTFQALFKPHAARSVISRGCEISQEATPLTVSDESTEASASKPHHTEIDAAINCCLNSNEGESAFKGLNHRLQVALTDAYRLLDHIYNDDEAYKYALEHPVLKERVRAPWKTNRALVAFQVSANPKDESESKKCSLITNVLICAKQDGVAVEDFPGWLSRITVAETVARVRARRRDPNGALSYRPQKNSNCRLTVPFKASDYPQLSRVLSDPKGEQFTAVRNLLAKAMENAELLIGKAPTPVGAANEAARG